MRSAGRGRRLQHRLQRKLLYEHTDARRHTHRSNTYRGYSHTHSHAIALNCVLVFIEPGQKPSRDKIVDDLDSVSVAAFITPKPCNEKRPLCYLENSAVGKIKS